MKGKVPSSVLLCIILFGASAFARGQGIPTNCGHISSVDAFGPEVAAKARSFVADLQKAVRSHDHLAVASMMHYPLRTTKIQIRTKAEFLKNYDELWTEDVKKALLTQDIACLSYASSGHTPESGSQVSFAIGHGEIWYWAFGKADRMKVITINN